DGQLGIEPSEPGARLGDGEIRNLGNVESGNLYRQSFGLEAPALADLAGAVVLVTRQLLAHPAAVRLAEAPLHVGNDAFEGLGRAVIPHAVVILHDDRLAAGAIQDRLTRLLRQILPRRVDADLEVLGQAFQRLGIVLP